MLADRLREARTRNPGLALILGDGTALPLPGHSVDLAVSFTVFSSVLDDDVRAAIAAELARVVRPGGRLLWYDLRRANPVNRQVRPVDRKDLRALFPGWTGDAATTTLLPPLARRLGRRADRWYPRLARLSPMRTHLIGVLTRPG
jgi:ubiquinone/menaquinone biosynthesis C-methylase UbiE